MMPAMQSQPRRRRSWRRFIRHNRNYFFAGFLGLIMIALVVLLFWAMTSSQFVKPH
jgi:hypothetical protein